MSWNPNNNAVVHVHCCLDGVSVSCSRGSERLSRWSRAKLTPHASSWLYPSKSRYLCLSNFSRSGMVKVTEAQQTSPHLPAMLVCYWLSIMSPICCSNPILSGDWRKAEKKTRTRYVVSVSWWKKLEASLTENSSPRCRDRKVWKWLFSTAEFFSPLLSLIANNQVSRYEEIIMFLYKTPLLVD